MQVLRSTYHYLRTNRSGSFKIALAACMLIGVMLVTDVFAWLSTAPNVPGTQDTILFPSVAADYTDHVHVTWLYVDDDDFSDGKVYYVRGKVNSARTGIDWESPQRLTSSTEARNPSPARVAVSSDGKVVHIVYGQKDGPIRYLRNDQSGQSGQWTSETVFNDNDYWNADINIDAAGVPYVVWGKGLDNDSSRIYYAYRRGANNWANYQITSGTYLRRRPRVAVSGSGSSAIVHVIHEYQNGQNTDWNTGYSRGQRDRAFENYNFGDSFGLGRKADWPDISVDHRTGLVFAGFIYDENEGYTLRLTVSRDKGVSWSNPPAPLRINSSTDPGHPALYAANNVVYIAARQRTSKDRVDYISYNAGTGQYSSWVTVSNSGQTSNVPRIAVTTNGKIVVWPRDNINRVQYNFDAGGHGLVSQAGPPPTATNTPRPPTPTTAPIPPTPTATPTPQRPQGSLELQGMLNDEPSTELVSTPVVDAVFTVTGGNPDQIRLSNDGTNWDEYEALPADKTRRGWTLAPAEGDNPACVFRTVRGQLKDSSNNTASDVLEATIQYDPGVQATVTVGNPHLSSNPRMLEEFDGNTGASDGHPAYTRSQQYYGKVTAGLNECSGLEDVMFGNMTPTSRSSSEVDGMFMISQLDAEDGTKDIEVNVVDGAGHPQTYQRQIILDQTAPSVTNALSSTLAVVDNSGQTLSESNNVIVKLRFDDVEVNDNLYGSRASEPYDVWGVWIANSTDPISITESLSSAAETQLETLDWQTIPLSNVEVNPDGSYNFTLTWSLFAGIQEAQDDRDYYVYARMLDGAGNYSPQVIGSNRVYLVEDALKPIVYLPFVRR